MTYLTDDEIADLAIAGIREDQAVSRKPILESALRATTDISGELQAVRDRYLRWFGPDYDLGALDVVLATAVAEKLDGDPPWLLLVGGSGAAKTETIMPLQSAGAIVVSTITGEAGLLSATATKERAKDATGGLLRELGPHGLLVIKDVTSILSMNRDTRALVLAALREVYDGHWVRRTGTEGGKTFSWRGRIVVIGAVTTAWDAAHAVVSAMGDRFVLVRLTDAAGARRGAGRQAMRNAGSEREMRSELSTMVGALLDLVPRGAGVEVDEAAVDDLLDVADLVTRGRTAVERDFKGNPLWAHALEMPTRFAKQLVGIFRGGVALGMTRNEAMATALRAARDSMPPHRLRVLLDVAEHPMTRTADVVKRLQLPRQTADKVLQELHLLELLVVDEEPYGTFGDRVRWIYTLAEGINVTPLLKFTGNVTTGTKEAP